ncbi:hypothetical protein V5O48_007563 [Marasmius crinis-equi]|uniref:Uncharacterized protein n=1 Tax=Marasmius crinis-equi TaxID=585013 RepID=A0ABR3FGE2_9AGAR
MLIKSTRPTSNHATSNPLKRDTGAWGKGSSPFPPMGSVTTPNTSAAASTSTAGAAPRKGAWGAPNPKITSAAPAAPAAPPGISIKVAKTASKGPPPAPADNNNASSASPPPLSNPENSASSASSTSSSTFSWADDVQNEMEQLEISRDTVVIADSTTTTVYGEPDELLGDEGEDEYSLPMAPGALSTSVPLAKASNDLAENLWAHHDEDDNEQGEEFQCSVHFGNTRLCKKGICSERAEYEKQKKRKEREQEREKAREKGQQKQGSKGKGSRGKGNRNLTKDNSRSTSRSAWGSNADQRSRSNSHSRSPAHREASPSAGSTAPVEEADPWF